MIRQAAWAGLALVAALPGAGWGQESADRARLDDFALPVPPAPPLQQIAPPRAPLGDEQRRDRSLVVPAPPAPSERTLPQVAVPEGAPPLRQLAPETRSAAAAPALSAAGDSLPRFTPALAGEDRCDPQSRDTRDAARCRRILELRAAEFQASRPPVLSAEQKLLAAQQEDDRAQPLQPGSGNRWARMAPQPDERASQELASVVLGTPLRSPSEPTPATVPEQTLAELIEAVVAGLPVPTN